MNAARSKKIKNHYRLAHKQKRINPLFPQKKPGLRNKVIFLFSVIVFIWIVGFLVFSERVQISNVNIQAPNLTTQRKAQEIIDRFLQEKRWFVLPQSNIFIIPAQQLAAKLNENFLLEELKIEKQYFNTLQVTMKEKVSEINVITQNRRFLVDSQGVVIQEIPQVIQLEKDIEFFKQDNTQMQDSEASQNINTEEIQQEQGNKEEDLPVIDFFEKKMIMDDDNIIVYDLSNSDIRLREQLFSEQWVQNILTITTYFKALTNVEIQYFTMPDISQPSLILHTSEQWQVLFDLNAGVERQLENLELVYKEKFFATREDLEYIDLRFDERVYYK